MGIFDGYLKSFKRQQDVELERMLKSDVFDIKLSDVKTVKFSPKDYTKEQVDQMILREYDKKSFLNELRRNIKPQALENMNIRLDGKTKDEVQKEREEEIKRKTKRLDNPDELVKEIEDEEPEALDASTARSEAIKSIYLTVAKEYYRLVNDLQVGKNGQIYTGSIINGTRIDNKIIMYQSYLSKLDLWYRNINGGMPIGFDDDVKQLLETEEYKKNKNDSITNSVRAKQVERIEDIQNELDAIEEEMGKISINDDNNPESTQRLSQLKKQYTDKRLELAQLSPSIGILHAEYVEKERLDELAHLKNYIVNDKYSARVLGQRNSNVDKRNEYDQTNMEDTIENVVHDELIDENVREAQEALDRFDEQFATQEYDDAIQSLIVAQSLITTASDTKDQVEVDNEVFERAKSESERIKAEKLNRERNDKMGIGAVFTEEEILSNDIAESLKGIRNRVKDEIEKAKSSSERCI